MPPAARRPAGSASHVSAYATSHPWEDWAETWAHYLHMVDLLETAASYSTRLVVPGNDADEAEEVTNPFERHGAGFRPAGRAMGAADPAAQQPEPQLGTGRRLPVRADLRALDKLRFVHDVIYAPAPAVAAPDIKTASQPSCQTGAATSAAINPT